MAEFPRDSQLLTALAYVDQKHGLLNQARELYQHALTLDPGLIDAADNLGVIEAETGHRGEAAAVAGCIPRRAWQKRHRTESGSGIL